MPITILMFRSNVVDLWVLKIMRLIVCLGCVFCCRIKKKGKDTFYINFNLFYIFPPNFFFLITSIE